MFGMPGGMEWGIILILVLIVFGAGKLPQVGRQLGSAINEFKEGVKPEEEEEEDVSAAKTKSDETKPEDD